MKIELVEEKKFGEDTWYGVYADGKYIIGSGNLERATAHYNALIADETALIPMKKILLSQEVGVNLQENNS